MKELFYAISEAITENITGIQNGEIKIWEFNTWISTKADVELCMNIACLLIVLLMLCDVIEIIIDIVEAKKASN